MIWAIIIMTGLIVGVTVIAGAALNKRPRRRGADPRDPVTALKASGALRHRKSNRP